MKIYRVYIFLLVLLTAGLGMHSSALASLSSFGNGDTHTSNSNPVSFLLFDLDHSGQATLSADTISFSGASLEYSADGSAWSAFGGPATIDFLDRSDTARILFRLNTGGSYDQDGQVSFQNYDAVGSAANNMDLFHSFYVVWDTEPINITISSSDDRFAATPIPASALLLFSGVIGLVSFRRRMAVR